MKIIDIYLNVIELLFFQFKYHQIGKFRNNIDFFFCICPPPGLLLVLGPCERYIYFLLISQMLSLQITNFSESTLHDIFVYKAGAFTYFFRT